MGQVYRPADRVVVGQGWDTLWYRSSLAPAERFDGSQDWGQTDSDNRGYVLETPVTIPVLYTSHNQSLNYDQAGAWNQGSAQGTIRVRHAIKQNDRLVPSLFPFPFEFTVSRGSGTEDQVRDKWIDSIELIRLNSSTKYTQGTDYQLNANVSTGVCSIEWLSGGSAPTEGDKYTVVAMIRPVWIVGNQPMIRALNRNQLPWKVSLVRDDIAVRGGA